ncbi:M55 family metallopeptidase [Phenylobacterium sp.]|uniref:M55 family metallopeptidase n=1 Tax=Phenylobacterium sp. TaxID=1871053 RepID=UPI0035B4E473
MRFYVSADIEGIAAVVSKEHTRPGGFEYEAARTWMTRSVVAVCEAARACGAEELVVSDSHGNGQNIHPDALPDYVQLVRSWPRPLGMMQGIERGRFDGVFLVGYHGGGSNPAGVLSHTLSSEFIHEVRLNGQPASEAVISAAIAGAFDAPVLMIAGDDVAVAETQALLGPMPGAILKEAYGSFAAVGPSPAVAEARLRQTVAEAVARAGQVEPYRVATPVTLELQLRTRFVAEWLAYLPEVTRVDAYTVRYQAADVVSLSHFLMFVIFARMATAA